MKKTAIILGATGLTGGILLKQLIEDATYKKIRLFSRSSSNNTSNKVEEHLVDLLKLETQKELFFADEVYCCIGTTNAKTKDKNLYKKIDYGIPVTAAKLAKINNIKNFIVLSSMGADVNSSVFYNKTKGEMERDVLAEDIKNTVILRPSLIGGNREEFRLGEQIGKGVMKLISPLLIGSLEKYKMIHPATIARAMNYLAIKNTNQKIFLSDEIAAIGKKYE